MLSMLSFRVAFSIFILERKKENIKVKNIYIYIYIYREREREREREQSSFINAFLYDRSVDKKGDMFPMHKKCLYTVCIKHYKHFPRPGKIHAIIGLSTREIPFTIQVSFSLISTVI